MKKTAICFSIALLAVMTTFFSCVPQPVPFLGGGAIVVNFIPVFEGEIVELRNVNASEHTLNGRKITFSDFKFYLSNIVLRDENGDFTDLSEIKLIDLTSQTSSNLRIQNIPLGVYQSIQFDIGVPPSENTDTFDPNRYGGTHPLNNEIMHDQGLSSYKFLVLEGNIGEGTELKTFTYGPGDNELFQNDKVIDSSFSLTDELDISIDIEVDLKMVLKNIDILTDLRITPANNLELGDDLISNLRGAIREKF